jgi:exosortase
VTPGQTLAVRARFTGPALLVGLSFLPILSEFIARAAATPNAALYPFLLAAAAWFVWHAWSGRDRTAAPRPWWGVCLAAVAWACLATAAVFDSPALGVAAALTALAAAGLAVGGVPLARRLAPAAASVLLVVLFQTDAYHQAALHLQERTADWGLALLDVRGVIYVRAGAVVESADRRFPIEAACGGVRALSAPIAAALLVGLAFRRGPWHVALLVGIGVAVALAGNVVRVAASVDLLLNRDLDVSAGVGRSALGLAVFVAQLLAIFSGDQLLWFFFDPGVEEPGADPAPPAGPGPAWSAAWPVAAAFGLLGAAQAAWCWRGPEWPWPPDDPAPLAALTADAVSERDGPWVCREFTVVRRDRGSRSGDTSLVWHGDWGGREATLSLSYPLPRGLEPTDCCAGRGWVVNVDAGDADGCVRVDLSRPPARTGVVLFGVMDGVGRPAARADDPGLVDRLAARWRDVRAGRWRWQGDEAFYQVQLLVEGYGPLTPDVEQEARAFFLRARERLCRRAFGGGDRP